MTKLATKPADRIDALMTRNPIRIPGGASAGELALMLDENEISGAPVVDGQDRIIGVVSRTDLLHRCVEGSPGSTPGQFLSRFGDGSAIALDAEALGVVSDFMNADPITARPDESIAAVTRRMIDERVHRVIIVDEAGQLQGIVTSLDLLKLIAK